jgi:transmembrane 9 superfamily protein 3
MTLRRTVVLLAALHARADEYTHTYEVGEAIKLWVNKVGPYHNPQETYTYFSLPFCANQPVDQLEHRYDWLGEVLEGNDLISSGLAVRFRTAVPEHTKVCSMVLDMESVAQFQYAVHSHYWYVQSPAFPGL